jgi:hypothetical protein
MKHLSGNVVSLKAFVPDVSDQTAFAVSKAMARYPEDRYESYGDFIAQLEDAKRRITDPNFRETQKKDVAIIAAGHNSKYGIWLILGVVAIVVILLGLFIWKGSALFKQPNTTPTEMSGYNPDAVPSKPNAPSH